MKLFVRKPLLLSLIEKKFGGVENFVSNWGVQIAEGRILGGRVKDSATIYRWLNNGLPANSDDVFGFFGALDLDPIAVLDVEKSGILKNFQKIRLAFQFGRKSQLAPLNEMFYPGPFWPSNALAERYYGRKWSTIEFAHEPNGVRNVYALLKLRIANSVLEYLPIAIHIAYRRKAAVDKMWRPYGSIIRINNQTRLLSESGDFQEKLDQEDFRLVRAETYFGPSPVEFKLASLHSFAMPDIEAPSTAVGVVRFDG